MPVPFFTPSFSLSKVSRQYVQYSQLAIQAALGVAQEALEREKGGIKALQEQLQCGKVSSRTSLNFLGGF